MTAETVLPVSAHMGTGDLPGEPWRVVVVNDGAVIPAGQYADRAGAFAFARVVRWSGAVHMIPAHTCPRCSGSIPNEVMRGRYPGALSRRHAGVEICSACGTSEALADWFGEPETAWWIA